jgi:hypothetical protein
MLRECKIKFVTGNVKWSIDWLAYKKKVKINDSASNRLLLNLPSPSTSKENN